MSVCWIVVRIWWKTADFSSEDDGGEDERVEGCEVDGRRRRRGFCDGIVSLSGGCGFSDSGRR